MAVDTVRQVVTVSEIADELGLSRQALHYELKRLQIEPTFRLRNGTWLFYEDQVPALASKVIARARKRAGGRPKGGRLGAG